MPIKVNDSMIFDVEDYIKDLSPELQEKARKCKTQIALRDSGGCRPSEKRGETKGRHALSGYGGKTKKARRESAVRCSPRARPSAMRR